jgi:hypothetical protein
MKNHEWKAMGRVIYGSRKTAFFEEKKANFAARLNCTTHRANRVCENHLIANQIARTFSDQRIRNRSQRA